MKVTKDKLFPDRSLSLEFLAKCAVPIRSDIIFHPLGEELTRLRRSAILVQRKWRRFLQARGPYRVTLCRYYMGQGRCQNGVNCTFAHGNHDIRPYFVPREWKPRKRPKLSHPVDPFDSIIDRILSALPKEEKGEEEDTK